MERACPARDAPSKYQYDGLEWVSCASTAFCVAVDGSGNAFTYNGRAWSAPAKVDSSTAMEPNCAPGKAVPTGWRRSPARRRRSAWRSTTTETSSRSAARPGAPLAPVATGSRLSVKAGAPVSVVGVAAKAKPGAKVHAKLSGRESKSATLTVSATHSFTWSLGKLKAGDLHSEVHDRRQARGETTTIKVLV